MFQLFYQSTKCLSITATSAEIFKFYYYLKTRKKTFNGNLLMLFYQQIIICKNITE